MLEFVTTNFSNIRRFRENGFIDNRALFKYICTRKKQSHYRPGQALRETEAPRFQDSRHTKVIRLSALCTGHLYPQATFLVLISVRG